ncbi:hypothetical protein Lal_00041582 [Lupinus albus]|uniref:Uncharacterized protein n=1 Tax=Lupinus albus TaxID=3870 RepID=A0A6A4P4N9_LUPAL|nr:hypothetical protein Lalb_Chr16g0389101 [Lupinus albus]KAF1874137.1 hypothetical protein Lal_00041582 [Lupinus albus]
MSIENVIKEENVEDDDEELSLCDLPITLINIKTQDQIRKEDSFCDNETQEEFYFLISKEQEMCDADDVFFQGQILPLCSSLSSKACLLTKYNDHKGNHQLNHSDLIRFKSLDLSHSEIQCNSSSPSNSVTSHNSTTPRISISNSETKNQFHTHPSPKPQLKKPPLSKTNGRKSSSSSHRCLRIGVIPTPDIRLEDLKIHSASATTIKPSLTSTDKNCESHNSRKSVKKSKKTHHHVDNNKHHGFKNFVHKGGGLFKSGCKCSVGTVCSSIVKIKGGTKSVNITKSTQHNMKEKVVELKKEKHGAK